MAESYTFLFFIFLFYALHGENTDNSTSFLYARVNVRTVFTVRIRSVIILLFIQIVDFFSIQNARFTEVSALSVNKGFPLSYYTIRISERTTRGRLMENLPTDRRKKDYCITVRYTPLRSAPGSAYK